MCYNGIMKKVITMIGAIFVYVILGLTVVVPLAVTQGIMDIYFKKRVTRSSYAKTELDYEGLVKEPKYFSNSIHKLGGGLFRNENIKEYRGVIIVSHGIGCSLYSYIQVIDYFTRKGWLVFGFDMSGCDSSEGSGMVGLQQAVIDLKHAIKYVRELPETQGLKLCVFGHSWSGYASAAVLNDSYAAKTVDAVASTSGFNKFWDIVLEQCEKVVGDAVKLAKPAAYACSYFKFGKYANYTGIGGVNNFKKPILIAQSKDDPTVQWEDSIAYRQNECTNPKAEFLIYDDLKHSLHRPKWAEDKINESCVGKKFMEKGNMNNFQYLMERRYQFVSSEVTLALNEEYMDKLEDFFERAIKEA